MNKTWQCLFVGSHPSEIELLRKEMSSPAYALRKKNKGRQLWKKARQEKKIMYGTSNLQKICVCLKKFEFLNENFKKKDMNKFWHFTAWSLIPGVISGERRGRGWRRAREREETERGNRSGRLGIEEKRVILRVWPGGMLNNGWLRRRVGRRGEVGDVITSFFLSDSLHVSTLFFLFFSISDPNYFVNWHYMRCRGIICRHTFNILFRRFSYFFCHSTHVKAVLFHHLKVNTLWPVCSV